MAGFLWGALIGQCQEGCPDDRIRIKNHFSESKPGAEWAKLWVNSIQTLSEFVEKLVNLDEKVIWNFLTLITKNKLDGVSFLMNVRICLILVLGNIVFHYIWLKYIFGTVTIDSDILLHNWVYIKKKKANPYFPIFWVGRKRANKHFFLGLISWNIYVLIQCCQRRGLPAQLGYFEILCRGSKNCLAGGLKLGYFSFVCPRQLFFLQICQFPVNSESFWASSMSKNILFINFSD